MAWVVDSEQVDLEPSRGRDGSPERSPPLRVVGEPDDLGEEAVFGLVAAGLGVVGVNAALGLDPGCVFGAEVDLEEGMFLVLATEVRMACDRDCVATERLLSQLIMGWYAKSPTGIRVPESHNGFVQHAVHTRTYVRDGIHLETQRTHRLFALFDGVEYIGLSAAWPEPPIPAGEAFKVKTVPTANGYLHQFWHTTPMRRGETYELTYRIPNPDPKELGWLVEDSLAFHEPTRFASFEVVFMGAAPRVAWSFDGLTALEHPGEPARAHLLKVGTDGRIVAEFRDVYGGLFCGAAWEW